MESVSNNSAESIQEQQEKNTGARTRQGRSAPLVFSNPFHDGVYASGILEEDYVVDLPCSSVCNDATKSHSYQHSPQHSPMPGGYNYQPSIGDAHSEISPLLADDLSRGYQSRRSRSRERIDPPTNNRVSIPTRIFTGRSPNREQQVASNSNSNSNNSPYGNRSKYVCTDGNHTKKNIIMKELASGDDHDQTIHMEYKFILLEDLGTAASWVILVLPYITFSLSMLIEYFTPISVSSIGPIGTALRASCFIITCVCVVFWIRKMKIRCCCCFYESSFRSFIGLFQKGKASETDDDQQRKSVEIYWWEDPWIIFPERYYVLPLLLFLLLVHEPALIILYYCPNLGSGTQNFMHVVSDATAGVGVQGILLIYLCLLEGFGYHTSERSKQRAQRQRKALQLRRAVTFIADGEGNHNINSPTVVENYYEEYGDLDGSAFTDHLRCFHDPLNSSSWADFLLPKIVLWLVGVLSATMLAYTQLVDNKTTATSSTNLAINNDTMYIVNLLVHGSTIIIWTYLIIIALYVTGEKLRREKFLGTRPAQLAYRIVFAHSALTLAAFFVSVVEFIRQLRDAFNDDRNYFAMVKQGNVLFSGVFGRLISITVQIVITAFIFLPPHTMDLEEDGGDDDNNERTELQILSKNKMCKRLVVHLAKHSKTWRIFPCPIQVVNEIKSSPYHDNMYQIYKDLHIDRNTHQRGLVSMGPYIPVFCAELACYLNEASWQAYYSPQSLPGFKDKNDFYGWMKLGTIGLRLEGYIFNERTNTQAYVATNSAPQIDGEEDSVIVVAFRGTSNTTNMQIDLRMNQVPLVDQITGVGDSPPFRIFPDHVEVCDGDGWIWNTDTVHGKPIDPSDYIKCVNCWTAPPCTPTHTSATAQQQERNRGLGAVVPRETVDILKNTPLARDTFPMVHEGFQDAYNEIRKQIFDLLLPVLQRQLAKSLRSQSEKAKQPLALPKIYCTGHSLGGSLAQLFAFDLASNCELILGGTKELRLRPPIAVYTFGQPRVGNRSFSRMYKQRVPHSFRVVNEGDAITTIPNYLCCGGLYKHAGLEVILDANQTGHVIVGPNVVETMFRFHKVRTNVSAHQMAKYRDCLQCIFDPSELLEYYRDHNVLYQELMVDLPDLYGDDGADNSDPGKWSHNSSRTTSRRNYADADLPEWMIVKRQGNDNI